MYGAPYKNFVWRSATQKMYGKGGKRPPSNGYAGWREGWKVEAINTGKVVLRLLESGYVSAGMLADV